MKDNKVLIAALIDDDLFDYISERISGKEKATMSNFSHMDIDEVRRIAGGRAIDLAIKAGSSFWYDICDAGIVLL